MLSHVLFLRVGLLASGEVQTGRKAYYSSDLSRGNVAYRTTKIQIREAFFDIICSSGEFL